MPTPVGASRLHYARIIAAVTFVVVVLTAGVRAAPGVLTAANAAGQLVFLPSMAWLTAHAGWRVMSLSLTAVVIGFVPILVWLMRDRPEDLGLAPYGGTRSAGRARPTGNPVTVAFRALGEGARLRDFWLLAGSYFVCGASTNGLIGTHLIPACIDHGLTEIAGASLP